jgi:transcriptional regulator with XRE-family HTH domain
VPASFGQKLTHLRRRHAMRQAELARRLGLHQSFISYLEAGRKEPSITLVLRIADLFGVTTDYLVREGIGVEAAWPITQPDSAATE